MTLNLSNVIIHPFGFNASEKEHESLPKVFLHETAFNKKALDPTVSIIMGRRGSGKTALAQYMRFEHDKPYDIYVDIDEPKLFSHILEQLSRNLKERASLNVIDDVAKMWELSFWTSLMTGILSASNAHPADTKDHIERYLKHIGLKSNKTSQVIRAVFQSMASIFSEKAGTLVDLAFKVNDILCSPEFNNAKASVIQYLNRGHRAVIIIDTLEQYDIRKEAMRQALGAMLQAVTNFSLGSIHKNLHIKCFLPSEIVPYLTESSMQNIGKSLEFPIFLHWRPRDLLRVACKRLFLTLEAERPSLIRGIRDIDWADFNEVRGKVWNKFFPPIITNHLGFEEDSFQYVFKFSFNYFISFIYY